MEKIVIEIENIKSNLINLIKEYANAEKKLKGLEYQKTVYYLMGQIDLLAGLINMKWERDITGECYYEFLNRIIEELNLSIKEKFVIARGKQL